MTWLIIFSSGKRKEVYVDTLSEIEFQYDSKDDPIIAAIRMDVYE